jgi:hypothetical protein
MARTLRATEPAASCILCIAVEDDGATVKDFVTTNSVSIDAFVSVGTSTWGGVSLPVFETKPSAADGFAFHGVRWHGALPSVTWSTSAAFFMAGTGYSQDNNFLMTNQAVDSGLKWSAANYATFWLSSLERVTGSTSIGANSRFSFAGNWRKDGVVQMWSGADGSPVIIEASAINSGTGTNTNVKYFGGAPGQGYTQAKWYMFAMWNRGLTDAEVSNLNADFMSVMFTDDGSSGGGGDAPGFRPWYTRTGFIVGGGGLA